MNGAFKESLRRQYAQLAAMLFHFEKNRAQSDLDPDGTGISHASER